MGAFWIKSDLNDKKMDLNSLKTQRKGLWTKITLNTNEMEAEFTKVVSELKASLFRRDNLSRNSRD